MYFRMFLVGLVFLCLVGCATTKRSAMNLEIERLQTKIGQLEREAQQKNREISELEYELDRARADARKVKETKLYPENKVVKTDRKEKTKSYQATSKKIQAALKNAGFYKGSIDGKIGKATKNAIMDFQKANGLKVDGIVGDKTWTRLSKYLN